MPKPETAEFDYRGHRVRVERNQGHPRSYLWCWIDDAGPLFLGHYRKGMTRADLKRLVDELLERRRADALRKSKSRHPEG